MPDNETQNMSMFNRTLNMTPDELAKIIVVVGVLENMFTFSIFCILGIKSMIAITFIGAVVFVYSAVYLRHKSLSIVFALILTYTIISVVVAVSLTDWEYGFQNYLFTTVPICVALVYNNRNFKTVLHHVTVTLFLISLTYILSHYMSVYLMPNTGADLNFKMFVNIINALFVIVLNYVVLIRLLSELYKDNKSLSIANKNLIHQADRDFLTNLYNRRFAEKVLEDIKRKEAPSCFLVLCDVDHFKSFNDTYGHNVGDEILEHISRIIVGNLNHRDYAVRWGGEEFLLIIGTEDIDVAKRVVERIMKQLHEVPYTNDQGELEVTVTSGISVFDPKRETVEEAIANADRRLYIGKKTGRNRYITEG